MKAIQITVDEGLLHELDEDDEVKRKGRSAVIRQAVFDYLRRRRRDAVGETYLQAYGGKPAPDVDWVGWGDDSPWPDE